MQEQAPARKRRKMTAKARNTKPKKTNPGYGTGPKMRSMAMNNPYQNIQPKSNMPGFNFPGAVM